MLASFQKNGSVGKSIESVVSKSFRVILIGSCAIMIIVLAVVISYLIATGPRPQAPGVTYSKTASPLTREVPPSDIQGASKEVNALVRQADTAVMETDFKTAISLYSQAIKAASKENADPNVLSIIYSNQAVALSESANPFAALNAYEMALLNCRPPVSLEADKILTAIVSLANNRRDMKMKARYLERQIALREKLYGKKDLRCAARSYDLMLAYRFVLDYKKIYQSSKKAIDYFRAAGVQRDKRLDDCFLTVLISANHAGKLGEATALLKEELKRRERLPGLKPDELRAPYFWLGSAYLMGDKNREALPYLKQSWDMTKDKYVMSLDAPHLVRRLAGAYRATGNLEQAKSVIEEYFTLVRAGHGDDACFSFPATELGIVLWQEKKKRESDKCLAWAEELTLRLPERVLDAQKECIRRVKARLNNGESVPPSFMDGSALYKKY